MIRVDGSYKYLKVYIKFKKYNIIYKIGHDQEQLITGDSATNCSTMIEEYFDNCNCPANRAKNS